MAYDSKAEQIKHYRVDKMLHIKESSEIREGKHCFRKFDMAIYARKMFAMYGGEEADVRIECENGLVGAIIDRFGRDIMIHPTDTEHFAINVQVAVSRQFIHWVMALGDGAKITGPEHVVAVVREEVRRLQRQYSEQ